MHGNSTFFSGGIFFLLASTPLTKMSDSRHSKKKDKSGEQYIIEEQLVLRVPPEIADVVRQMVQSDTNSHQLSFVMGTSISPLLRRTIHDSID